MSDFYNIGVGIDMSGAENSLQRATGSIRDFGAAGKNAMTVIKQGVSETQGSLSSLSGSFSSLMGMARNLGIAIGAVELTRLAADATMLAARFETLGVALGVLGNRLGYTQTAIEAVATGVQRMGITMTESRQSVAMMIESQIDLSNATKLARVAQDAAVIGGMNSSETFQRLTYAIQSGQVRILRSIGLNLTFGESYDKLAASMGKSADQLTDSEKVQARVNAVMEKASLISGAYSAAMGTAGKQMYSMQRYWQDLLTTLGNAALPEFTKAVFALADALKWLTQEAAAHRDALEELVNLLADGAKVTAIYGLAKGVTVLGTALKTLVVGTVGEQFVLQVGLMRGALASIMPLLSKLGPYLLPAAAGMLAFGIRRELSENNAANVQGMTDTAIGGSSPQMQGVLTKRALEASGKSKDQVDDWLDTHNLGSMLGQKSAAASANRQDDENPDKLGEKIKEQADHLKDLLQQKKDELAIDQTMDPLKKEQLKNLQAYNQELAKMHDKGMDQSKDKGVQKQYADAVGLAKNVRVQSDADAGARMSTKVGQSVDDMKAQTEEMRKQAEIDQETDPIKKASLETEKEFASAYAKLKKEFADNVTVGQLQALQEQIAATFNDKVVKAHTEALKANAAVVKEMNKLQEEGADTADKIMETQAKAGLPVGVDSDVLNFIKNGPLVQKVMQQAVSDKNDQLKASGQGPMDAGMAFNYANAAGSSAALKIYETTMNAAIAGGASNDKQVDALVAEHAREVNQVYENLQKEVQGTFTQMFDKIAQGGLKTFQDFANSVKQTFLKLAAEMTSAQVTPAIMQLIMGTPQTFKVSDGKGGTMDVTQTTGGLFGKGTPDVVGPDGTIIPGGQHKGLLNNRYGQAGIGAAAGYYTGLSTSQGGGSLTDSMLSGAEAGSAGGVVGMFVGGLAGMVAGIVNAKSAADALTQSFLALNNQVALSLTKLLAQGSGQAQNSQINLGDSYVQFANQALSSLKPVGINATPLSSETQLAGEIAELQDEASHMAQVMNQNGGPGAAGNSTLNVQFQSLTTVIGQLNQALQGYQVALQNLQAQEQMNANLGTEGYQARLLNATGNTQAGAVAALRAQQSKEMQGLVSQGASGTAGDTAAYTAELAALSAAQQAEMNQLLANQQQANTQQSGGYATRLGSAQGQLGALQGTAGANDQIAQAAQQKLQLQQQQEMYAAQSGGASSDMLNQLQQAQAAETALAAAQTKAANDNSQASSAARTLAAQGYTQQAAQQQLALQQQQEYQQAVESGLNDASLAALKLAQNAEAAKQAADQANQDAQASGSLQVRMLNAEGQTGPAQLLQEQLKQQAEMQAAIDQYGANSAYVQQLAAVQALEYQNFTTQMMSPVDTNAAPTTTGGLTGSSYSQADTTNTLLQTQINWLAVIAENTGGTGGMSTGPSNLYTVGSDPALGSNLTTNRASAGIARTA